MAYIPQIPFDQYESYRDWLIARMTHQNVVAMPAGWQEWPTDQIDAYVTRAEGRISKWALGAALLILMVVIGAAVSNLL